MPSPIINIITRFSEKENLDRCLKSIYKQTYQNIHHIITYEHNKDREYLESKLSPNIDTTLVKVPNLKAVKGLSYTYNHHDYYTKFLEPNYEFWDKKPYSKEDMGIRVDVDPVKFKLGSWWCETLGFTFRVKLNHFPYNLYIKEAEKFVKEGWIAYLDNDDEIIEPNGIEELVKQLEDEDTLHIVKFFHFEQNQAKPDKFWLFYQAGHPFVYNDIGTYNIIFHTKYCKYTLWDEWRGADYRTARALEEVIPKKKFIDKIIVKVI